MKNIFINRGTGIYQYLKEKKTLAVILQRKIIHIILVDGNSFIPLNIISSERCDRHLMVTKKNILRKALLHLNGKEKH